MSKDFFDKKVPTFEAQKREEQPMYAEQIHPHVKVVMGFGYLGEVPPLHRTHKLLQRIRQHKVAMLLERAQSQAVVAVLAAGWKRIHTVLSNHNSAEIGVFGLEGTIGAKPKMEWVGMRRYGGQGFPGCCAVGMVWLNKPQEEGRGLYIETGYLHATGALMTMVPRGSRWMRELKKQGWTETHVGAVSMMWKNGERATW